jgi:peptidoglycan hydrolase-like protein with peptidoglycan-binding domain
MPGVVPTYTLGSTGEGVKSIQSRLAALGCYSGQISGNFDASTVAGVTAFKAAQNNPLATRKYDEGAPILLFSSLMPSPGQVENNAGDVGPDTWTALFSLASPRCD